MSEHYDNSATINVQLISIHAPLAGRDHGWRPTSGTYLVLETTRPVRGATSGPAYSVAAGHISIHAPRAGRDCMQPSRFASCSSFQSTHPSRGATRYDLIKIYDGKISIHAPHAGRDAQELKNLVQRLSFNPRAPCGARLVCASFTRI